MQMNAWQSLEIMNQIDKNGDKPKQIWILIKKFKLQL